MSQLEFMNAALDRIKHTSITEPTEDPQVLRQYKIVSRAWLTEAWWTFNTVTETLPKIIVPEETYLFGYSNVFAYPQTPEVLRVHDGEQTRAPYRLALLKQGTHLTKAVFSHQEQFTMVYGAAVDEQYWTATFIEAFILRLAVELARTKTGAIQLLADLKQDWAMARAEALRVDAFQQFPMRPATNIDMLMNRWRGSLAHMDPFLVEAGEGTP